MIARRFIIFLCAFAFVAGTAFTVGTVEQTAAVVATTSWTSAFAEAAGADSIHVLAPYELRHPPEYELAPSDVRIIGEAQFVIFAGYERMVERLKEAVGDGPELIQIATTYAMEVIRTEVTKIGRAIGTLDEAQAEIERIEEFYRSWRSEIAEQGLSGSRVICHMFQAPLARELGLEVVGTFGPAPLEAQQITRLSETEVDFIIDNWHNDVGKPLTETMPDTPVVTFVNFPGHDGTRTLLDVLEYNREILAEL